jgi:La-related protein 7
MADAPRHKSLRTRLQRQLEFYLSESNLRQDKFLRQSMDARGFVPAQLFLSFNRLKALKATERLVLEVADKSPLLRADLAAASIAPLALPDADSHDAGTVLGCTHSVLGLEP